MKLKVVSGIMLTLFLVSMLSTVVSVSATPSIPGDINGDGIVDIDDVSIVALAFGSYPGNPRWNPQADLKPDNLIDIFDLVIVGVNFGKTG